eukprot:439704-Pelagomonas_calceolata.AAC.5
MQTRRSHPFVQTWRSDPFERSLQRPVSSVQDVLQLTVPRNEGILQLQYRDLPVMHAALLAGDGLGLIANFAKAGSVEEMRRVMKEQVDKLVAERMREMRARFGIPPSTCSGADSRRGSAAGKNRGEDMQDLQVHIFTPHLAYNCCVELCVKCAVISRVEPLPPKSNEIKQGLRSAAPCSICSSNLTNVPCTQDSRLAALYCSCDFYRLGGGHSSFCAGHIKSLILLDKLVFVFCGAGMRRSVSPAGRQVHEGTAPDTVNEEQEEEEEEEVYSEENAVKPRQKRGASKEIKWVGWCFCAARGRA